MNVAAPARGFSCFAAATLLADDRRFGGADSICHPKRQLFKYTNQCWNFGFWCSCSFDLFFYGVHRVGGICHKRLF